MLTSAIFCLYASASASSSFSLAMASSSALMSLILAAGSIFSPVTSAACISASAVCRQFHKTRHNK